MVWKGEPPGGLQVAASAYHRLHQKGGKRLEGRFTEVCDYLIEIACPPFLNLTTSRARVDLGLSYVSGTLA